VAVGDGACRYGAVLAAVGHVTVGEWGNAYPSAAVLVELAHPLALREEFVTPAEVAPLYLRPADVRINWATRGAGSGSGAGNGAGAVAGSVAGSGAGSVAGREVSGGGLPG